jgi:hypothetical protein
VTTIGIPGCGYTHSYSTLYPASEKSALYRDNQREKIGDAGGNEKGLGHSHQEQQDGEKIYPLF